MIFIDGSNMFLSCRRHNIKIKYEKLIEFLKKDRNVMRISYYSGVNYPITEEQNKFFKMLRQYLEIDVITRPLKLRKTKCEKCHHEKTIKIEKGIDANLSIDLLWYAIQNAYDIAIIISGDTDYIPAIEKVRLLGKRVELWSFKDSLGADLKKKVDKINYLDDIVDKIT